MNLENKSRFNFHLLMSIVLTLGFLSCSEQNTVEDRNINLKEAYFGSHFMIDLDSIDVVFDTTLVSNFQRLGKDRDWINTATSTGENVLILYREIKTHGKYISPIYLYSSGSDSVANNNKYLCRCSKSYFWKEYALIYCEMVISPREKYTQNFFFKNDSLIFSQDSGKLLTN